ncbi:MAG: dodecin domain-containing protein [Chloroflexi bacterium]|jgi:flavin-binding protein dodecin|nr:dodecin domain-containing protein [Chloroflexota bacterium]
MAIVKVIEVLAQSPTSWEDATREALREVSKTVRNIQTLYIKDFQAVVDEQGEITAFRVNAKVSFIVESDRD